jgi:hypothetical protein
MRNFKAVLAFAGLLSLVAFGQNPIGAGITQPNAGGGGVVIGNPVTGGDYNDILFVDASGNLGQDDYFSWTQTGGFQATNADTIVFTQTGPSGTIFSDTGGGGIEILDTGNGGIFFQSNQVITISSTGPYGIVLDNTGSLGLELQDTGGGGIIFNSSSTYNFATFTPVSSSPVCVTSAGNLEVGSLAAGLVTCP